MSDEIPRRNQINRWTAAERAIAALLGEARQSVADYVDGVVGPRRGVLYFEDRGQASSDVDEAVHGREWRGSVHGRPGGQL